MMGMSKERIIARINRLKANDPIMNEKLIKKWERKLRKING